MQTELNELVPALLQIVREAGAAILDIYESGFEVQSKEDRSPVTAADMAAHRIIAARLPGLLPGIPVLSEEGGLPAFSRRGTWPRYWLVDPLDGTKEFIKRNGEFTVNIALIDQHRPVLGVVSVPAQGIEYYGGPGLGAFRCQVGVQPVPIGVSKSAPAPVRVVGSRSHASPAIEAYLENLGAHEMVPMGSSLKFCLVAEGKADVYPRLGPTSEWDTAAAHAVVLGAGGKVTDWHGDPLLYNAKEDILNPNFLVYGDDSRDWAGYLGS
jgi:3'(2'), 5'-bisphosphate nucleotidase